MHQCEQHPIWTQTFSILQKVPSCPFHSISWANTCLISFSSALFCLSLRYQKFSKSFIFSDFEFNSVAIMGQTIKFHSGNVFDYTALLVKLPHAFESNVLCSYQMKHSMNASWFRWFESVVQIIFPYWCYAFPSPHPVQVCCRKSSCSEVSGPWMSQPIKFPFPVPVCVCLRPKTHARR